MQVSTEQLAPCEVELKIEVGADQVAQAVDQVYREFSHNTSIPGFRKGKTPRKILERYVTPESVRKRAVEIMIPTAYMEAVKEKDIEPYTDPEVEIVQFETEQPFIFKATVPLPPKVELGDYRGIEVDRKVQEIADQDVEEQLGYIRDRQTTSKPVEGRGAQDGDVLVAEISSTVGDEEKSAPRRSMIEVGSNVPGFDDNVHGMEPGQRRNFSIEYPKDYPDEKLAGKIAEFDVAVESVKEKVVPELDDEFARSVGSFETLEDLKADIRKHLVESANDAADREVEHRILEEVVSRSEICFPDVIVEHDVYHDMEELRNRLSRQGIAVQQYLQQTGKTQEDLLNELRESARRRIRIGLVLGEISDAENIDVTDDDISAEIARMAEESKTSVESVESLIETRGGRNSLKNRMLNRAIMDFLRSVSRIK